ncbi:MAG: hypothetical protein EZS28_038583 [Streblomastix strix]|uniref:Uncharacterized protein n=1 Tax=Streblomastix strix TaxID=222440 RepID=A0A5J4U7P1_9EUKA|nr:MAG: hypothetical protein EZS28_038583 [Streblomastix strix]
MQVKSSLYAFNLHNWQKSSPIRYGVLIPRCLIMLINVVTAEENGKKRLQRTGENSKYNQNKQDLDSTIQSKSENQSVLKCKISFDQKSFEAYENKVMVAFTTKTEQPKKRMSIFQQIHPDQMTFIYNLFPWMRNMRQKFYQQYYYLDIQVKNYLLEMYQVAVLYKQRGYEVVYAVNKPISQSKKWVDYFLRAVDNEVVIRTDPRRFDQQGLLAEIKNE